jgi:uncharacterized protein
MSPEIAANPRSSGLRESRYNVVLERGDYVWIFNTLSGRVINLSVPDWEATRRFLSGAETYPAVELLHDLTLGRMIVNDDLDELDVLERRYRKATGDRTSFALTIVTSLGCNFDCPYCYQVKPRAILDEETQQLLLDVLDEQLATIETFGVTWFGGEPLLATDRIYSLSREFIERCDAAGVQYSASIITNGYLLTPGVARRLRELRVTATQITLDGPAETHNLMRPLRNGRGTFDVILDNIVASADILPIGIRVNIDRDNASEYERLLDVLVERGLAGRVTAYPGQLVAYDEGIGAPSETYRPQCLTLPEFAALERRFDAAARERGLAATGLPQPIMSPCTAVRVNELVVGANGELYKCWDSVGNNREVVGHLRSWRDPNDRALKWLSYDPFTDDGCRGCIALPTCMGGCAHHAMLDRAGDSKCSTFRTTYREQVEEYADAAEAAGATGLRHALLPLVEVSG